MRFSISYIRSLFKQGPLNRNERLGVPATVIGALLLCLYPFLASGFGLSQLRDGLILSLLALSLDFIWGRAHLLVLGQALFWGVGAYAVAILSTKFGIAPGLGTLVGCALSGAVAGVVGYFLLFAGVRLHYFAVLTIAMSLIVNQVVISWSAVTGGDIGLLGIPPFRLAVFGTEISSESPRVSYYLALAALSAVLLALWLACRSPYGRVLDAMGTNEKRTRHLGFNTSAYLLVAFIVSSAIAALAGAMFASASGVVAPDLLGVLFSTEIVIWVAIGGRGTLLGPVIGTLLVTQLGSAIGSYSATLWPLILGALFVLAVLVLPGGIAALILSGWNAYLTKRAAGDAHDAS